MENVKEITMRHEEKYLCPESWLTIIEHRLGEFLPSDENQEEGGYSIRSLYFDTDDDRLYGESLDGAEVRDKFRIRIYNGSPDLIKLEKKTTIGSLKKKSVSMVGASFINAVLGSVGKSGMLDAYALLDTSDPVSEEFCILGQTEVLSPRIIIDYRRTAFVSEIGNIRITLDRNIRATDRVGDFLYDDACMLPLLPDNFNLLEVKYNGIFPGYMTRLLNIDSLERISFSKYVLCRDMIMNNGRKSGLYEF